MTTKDQVSGGEDNPVGLNMKCCSESHKEAAPQNLLSPRTTTQVGTWNVCTMYKTGKTAQIAAEMRGTNLPYSVSVRRDGCGQGRFAWPQARPLFINSGHEEDVPHTGAAGALLDWKAFSSRIISARFHTRICKLLIVQCYAPTNDSDAEKKSEFYGRLQAVVNQNAKKDLLIMMGDFNAKIGKDNTGKDLVMGKVGLGEMNENGELFTTSATSTVGYRGKCIPTQEDSQDHMDFTRPSDREPD